MKWSMGGDGTEVGGRRGTSARDRNLQRHEKRGKTFCEEGGRRVRGEGDGLEVDWGGITGEFIEN